MAKVNGKSNGREKVKANGQSPADLWRVKVGLAEMLKGGVIMDVTNVEQARIAEEAGACAVMALERVPSDIRKEGGVARMASPKIIRDIMGAVSIPVMAKVRIGHFAEAQVLEALEVDFIDESEVLTPADEENHVWKHDFRVPFVCGARNLGEALRRIAEGAAMIRTKGEAGSGNIVEAVRHMRAITSEMRRLTTLRGDELGSRIQRNWARHWNWCGRSRKRASCPCRIFRRAALRRPRMRRWCANLVRKRCSSARESSNRRIRSGARKPS